MPTLIRVALVVLLTLWVPGVFAQATQAPAGESTSRPQPPTPPDAPTPDQGTTPTPPPKSSAKRTLNKLDPHCIDAIFHTCWSAPAATPEQPIPDDEKQAAKDIDVGYYYLREKNYHAAESRLKEAVELKPDSSPALLGLAQAQQKLGENQQAKLSYETYLKLKPDGPDAEKVKQALAQLP
ncbi:MAG: tetratricopeptide repeat protein [Candidatus Korobacteraceae bacterium]